MNAALDERSLLSIMNVRAAHYRTRTVFFSLPGECTALLFILIPINGSSEDAALCSAECWFLSLAANNPMCKQ